MSHWTALTDPASLTANAQRGVPHSPLGAWSERHAAPPAPMRPERRAAVTKKQISMEQHLAQRWDRSFRRQLMLLLANGAMSRSDFRALAQQVYERSYSADPTTVPKTIKVLEAAGLISCEVKLTAEGMRKLGIGGQRA